MNNDNFKKAIIIDGHSLAYRAYFATLAQLEYFKKNNLFPTNAIRMMIIMVSKLLQANNYEYGLVAFDTSRKSFRTNLDINYKANRESMPEELQKQLPLIIEALKLFGFPIIAIEDFEADDVIATFATICNNKNVFSHIFTSDNDLLQLVDQFTSVHILKKGVSDIKIYSKTNFFELTGGLIPSQIVDLKTLAGDSSDNYKGIKGIGDKTALKLIKSYQSIDNIVKQLDQLPKSIQTKLKNAQSEIALFTKLATILKNAPIVPKLESYKISRAKKNDFENYLTKIKLPNLLKYFEF